MRAFRHFSTLKSPNNIQNAAGIFHLQENLQATAFGRKICADQIKSDVNDRAAIKTSDSESLAVELQRLSLEHLRRCSLLNQETSPPADLDLDLPPLLGNTLDEHFQKIGNRMLSPYLDMCNKFISGIKEQKVHNRESIKPQSRISGMHLVNNVRNWEIRSGWTKYTTSGNEPVPFPPDDVIVLDTEVLYQQHDFAVMATAVSLGSLYVWLSPWLLGESANFQQLIPLGPHKQVVIGHHVGFDRKRVKEDYRLAQSPKWFLDTMALHIVVSGMCNQQRATFAKYESLLRKLKEESYNGSSFGSRISKIAGAMRREDPWLEHTSANGLADTVRFYLGEYVDKSDRDLFGELTREELMKRTVLNKLIRYCAMDSVYTRDLFAELLPKFCELNPHPVSLASLKEIAGVFLPVQRSWYDYVNRSEALFETMQDSVKTKLEILAHKAAACADDPAQLAYAQNEDQWLRQLDWTIKPIRYTKARPGHPARPMKNQKMPGKPQWFRDLFSGKDTSMSLTSRSRTTVLLLRLKWDGHPLVWSDKSGWTFWASKDKKQHYIDINFPHVADEGKMCQFKLPHPDGEKGRCTNPLAKFYLSFFESGVLTSEDVLAKETINANLISSYWLSSRKRIMSQMPVFAGDPGSTPRNTQDNLITSEYMGLPSDWGIILPRMITMGAVTRRAVEDTWLTASNAKKDRIGSELKCNVRAPPGYKIIGADVDSEELWIAGVIGDSVFKMHGSTAFGWMTLEGSKKNGTDLHSKSAQILGINRNEAKVFNYGRIYGSGESSAVRSLRHFNPGMSIKEAQEKAATLYSSTKGTKTKSKVFPLTNYWRGGTESIMYNQLEMLADLPRQQTPVLGAGISNALSSSNLRPNSFMTTRVNWSIQSSGVDYLHLLIVSMRYLCDVFGIEARLMLTVHDEVRYLVKEECSLRAGLALQIANLWTRAMFCQQLGLDCLPQSVAFFSAIDFDTVLRKEVDDLCITPSQSEKLSKGQAMDIFELVKLCNTLGIPDQEILRDYQSQQYKERQPVMAKINDSPILLDYVRAQIGTADEAAAIEMTLRKNYGTWTKKSKKIARSRNSSITSKQANHHLASWDKQAVGSTEYSQASSGCGVVAADCSITDTETNENQGAHSGMRVRPRIPQIF